MSDCLVAATNGYMKWYKMDAPNRQANRQKIIGIRVVSSFLRIVFFVSLFISVALICLGSYSLYQGTYDDLIIELYFDGYSCLIFSILLGTLLFGSKFLIATSILIAIIAGTIGIIFYQGNLYTIIIQISIGVILLLSYGYFVHD